MLLLNRCIKDKVNIADAVYTMKTPFKEYPPSEHPDIQLCKIGEMYFTAPSYYEYYSRYICKEKLVCGKSDIAPKYPESVSYNCAYIGGKLFCNTKTADESIIDFCNEKGIELIHVNQGYTKCSMLAVGENAFITADDVIAEKGRKAGFDVLKIRSGHILLDGYDYGFIGGTAGMLDEKSILFFGDPKTHADGKEITRFIISKGFNIITLFDGTLTDVGGLVIF